MRIPKAHPRNVDGPFFVGEACCMGCGVPAALGGDMFDHDAAGVCWVRRQPATPTDLDAMIAVIEAAESDCIRYRGTDQVIAARVRGATQRDPVMPPTADASEIIPRATLLRPRRK